MKKTSAHFVTWGVAIVGLSLGFLGNPFGKKQKPLDAQEIEALYGKTKLYFEVGNFEGALDTAKKLPPNIPPRYADIREIQKQSEEALSEYKQKLKQGTLIPTHVDRLPAALRDSYYDANIEAQRGRCRAAYDNMVPVSKYLNNRADLEIFKRCQLTQRKSK